MYEPQRVDARPRLKQVVDVTVVIPTIPTRPDHLQRALRSVYAQSVEPAMINVHVDQNRLGAPQNRDLAVGATDTEWLAFLDDDDELGQDHLRLLLAMAQQTDADLVYPWFTVNGGTDPFPQWENVPWENDRPHQVPITFLVRTSVYRKAGGFSYEWDETQGEDPGVDSDGNRAGEDYRFILRVAQLGYKIVHLPRRTWTWWHHDKNTSGLPSRW